MDDKIDHAVAEKSLERALRELATSRCWMNPDSPEFDHVRKAQYHSLLATKILQEKQRPR